MRRVNFLGLVDVIALLLFSLLFSTGGVLLLKLPRRSSHQLSVLGFSRHDWSSIHVGVAILFSLVLIVHLAVHYRWIVGLLSTITSQNHGPRMILSVIVAIVLVAAFLLPLVLPVETSFR